MTHYDEMTCLLYLEGQLERPRALELSAHVQGCAECRALLRALECESRLLTQALVEEDEAVPARLLAPPAREATPWAWIISFGLAAAGSYLLWTGFIEPWRQQLSQAGFGEGNLLTLLFFRGAFWKGWGEMSNMIQFIAAATLGILALPLLRRTWRRWTTIALVMGTLLAVLTLPNVASAAEVIKSQTYALRAGETMKNDLIVTGSTISIDGTVEGDLICFSRSLTVTGHVTGDVIGFAQKIRISGRVDGNIRAFVNSLTISGSAGKNISSFAETVEVEPTAKVGGGLIVFASDVILGGQVGRDILAYCRATRIDGSVGGNILFHGHYLTIGDSAQVLGSTQYHGELQPEVSSKAKLASPVQTFIEKRRSGYSSPRFYLSAFLRWGASVVFGLLFLMLMPGFFADAVRSTHRYALSFGVGAIVLVSCVLLVIISGMLLIIGVGAGIITWLLFMPALYSGQVFVGSWIGEKLLGQPVNTEGRLGRFTVGTLLIRILGMLPYVGWLCWFAVTMWGVGALTLALYKRTRPESAAAPAGAGQAIA